MYGMDYLTRVTNVAAQYGTRAQVNPRLDR
jgi:hypothetical protein